MPANGRGARVTWTWRQSGRGRQPTGVTAADHPLLHELEYRGHLIDDLEFEFTLDSIIKNAENLLARTGSKARPNRAK